MPKQLCSPKTFRDVIAGKGKLTKIINENPNAYGVPQGTPISDLIANIYMMDFDSLILGIASTHGGRAFRYSDDILLVVQCADSNQAAALEEEIRRAISSFGEKLLIKESKSSIHRFFIDRGNLTFERIKGKGKNGLEYLGFRFDGQRIYLRDSTLSNLKRKMNYSARIRANQHRSRFKDKTAGELISSFNFDHFFQTFMRVEDFDKSSTVKNWTFWTYVRRARESFGARSLPILKQLKFLKPDGRRSIEKHLKS